MLPSNNPFSGLPVAQGQAPDDGAKLAASGASRKRANSSTPCYATVMQLGLQAPPPMKLRKTDGGREDMSSIRSGGFAQRGGAVFQPSVMHPAPPPDHADPDPNGAQYLNAMQERVATLAARQQQASSLSSFGSAPSSLFDRLTAQQQRAASVPSGLLGQTNYVGSDIEGLISSLGNRQSLATAGLSSLGQILPYAQRLNDISMAGRLATTGSNMIDSSSPLARQRLFQSMAASRASFSSSTGRGGSSLLLESAALNGFPGPSTRVPGLVSPSQSALLRVLHGPAPAPASLVHFGQPSVVAGRPSLEDQLRAYHAALGTATLNMCLPVELAIPDDSRKLSGQQVFLRHQIEAFQAGEDDITTHTRGRNKPIVLGQVGIRCKFCAHLPVVQKQKGSTYFPATLLGLYQAAQNMQKTHMQSGLCQKMPEDVKEKFANLSAAKVGSSGAGRPYWAKAAQKLGLVDTEDGIRSIRNLSRP